MHPPFFPRYRLPRSQDATTSRRPAWISWTTRHKLRRQGIWGALKPCESGDLDETDCGQRRNARWVGLKMENWLKNRVCSKFRFVALIDLQVWLTTGFTSCAYIYLENQKRCNLLVSLLRIRKKPPPRKMFRLYKHKNKPVFYSQADVQILSAWKKQHITKPSKVIALHSLIYQKTALGLFEHWGTPTTIG